MVIQLDHAALEVFHAQALGESFSYGNCLNPSCAKALGSVSVVETSSCTSTTLGTAWERGRGVGAELIWTWPMSLARTSYDRPLQAIRQGHESNVSFTRHGREHTSFEAQRTTIPAGRRPSPSELHRKQPCRYSNAP